MSSNTEFGSTANRFNEIYLGLELSNGRGIHDVDRCSAIRKDNIGSHQYGTLTVDGASALFQHLRLNRSDRFIDCGSGLGLVAMQAKFMCGCRSSGIEICHQRHVLAMNIMKALSKQCQNVSRSFQHEWLIADTQSHAISSLFANYTRTTSSIQSIFMHPDPLGQATLFISTTPTTFSKVVVIQDWESIITWRIYFFPRLQEHGLSRTTEWYVLVNPTPKLVLMRKGGFQGSHLQNCAPSSIILQLFLAWIPFRGPDGHSKSTSTLACRQTRCIASIVASIIWLGTRFPTLFSLNAPFVSVAHIVVVPALHD